jgi:hypothetical protein
MTDQSPHAYSVPPMLLGTSYPTEYVTSMFPDASAAQDAATALETSGFTPEGIVLVTGEQLLRNQRSIRDHRGLGGRLFARFPTEEAEIAQQYCDLAQQGYAVIAVHVPEGEPEERDRVAEALRSNGADYLHYFGKYSITDL